MPRAGWIINRLSYGPTNQPTNGQTRPNIEVCWRIYKNRHSNDLMEKQRNGEFVGKTYLNCIVLLYRELRRAENLDGCKVFNTEIAGSSTLSRVIF